MTILVVKHYRVAIFCLSSEILRHYCLGVHLLIAAVFLKADCAIHLRLLSDSEELILGQILYLTHHFHTNINYLPIYLPFLSSGRFVKYRNLALMF